MFSDVGYRIRRITNLLTVGALAWLIAGSAAFTFVGRPLPAVIILAVMLGLGVWLRPSFAGRVFGFLNNLRRPTPRTVRFAFLWIAAVSAAYLLATSLVQGRYLGVRYADDWGYLIQTQMLRMGKLWMPPHPLGDFFDSFYVLTWPKYVSQYFPGTAMMYVSQLWLGLPLWVVPLLLSACAAGLMYVIITELIDGLAGALAVVMYLSALQIRRQSLAFSAQPVILFLSLVAVWAWLRWRRRHQLRWVVLLGVAVGWSALTRPVDALCFATPISLAMLVDLRRAGLREWVRTIATGLAAVAPLLAVQVVLNYGVSGSITVSPFQLYANRDYPGTMFGFHRYDPASRPQTRIAAKRVFFDQWAVPYIRLHQAQVLWRDALTDRLPFLINSSLANPVLFALTPFGLFGGWRLKRAVLAASLGLFFALYLCYTFFLPHYCLTAMPGLILLSLLGLWRLLARWRRHRQIAVPLAVLAVLVLCAGSVPELNGYVADTNERFSIARVTAALELVRKPAVVLFHYDPRREVHEEPVYNGDVAWPDEAPIIRAHDLGQRNIEIFCYFAASQPQRRFYVYDEGMERLSYLGTAEELARQTHPAASYSP